MDPELKRQLEEIHALAKDNHQMLRAMRRAQWFGAFVKIVIWITVLALPLYLYQEYLQPLVEKFSVTGVTTSSSLPTSAEVQKLLNSLKAGQ